ncbi:MAG: hypothetical protein IJ801_05050 [Lachnospiraceae bacterium]|nr:hypothetical protein [Lachnospiraceae bacterium]
MKTKKWIGILLLSTMFFTMTGCMRLYETLTVSPDDVITVTVKNCLSKEYVDSTGQTVNPDAKVETLEDGKQYYTQEETSHSTVSEFATDSQSGDILTKDIFYSPINSGGTSSSSGDYDLEQAIANDIYVQMTIQLADEIVDTNANMETSGNTAIFNTVNPPATAWYAYTAAGKQQIETDQTAPVIHGVQQNKYYKALPKITFSDNIGVCKMQLNGVDVAPQNSTTTTTVNGKRKSVKVYDWYQTSGSMIKSAKKQGKNVFTVYDLSGNSSSVTFYLDTKAPVVKGVKKNKTYQKEAVLYIKDTTKLSKVTIDKKQQKLSNKKLVKTGKYKGYYQYKITKAGKHTVAAYDAAGNKTSVTFKVIK